MTKDDAVLLELGGSPIDPPHSTRRWRRVLSGSSPRSKSADLASFSGKPDRLERIAKRHAARRRMLMVAASVVVLLAAGAGVVAGVRLTHRASTVTVPKAKPKSVLPSKVKIASPHPTTPSTIPQQSQPIPSVLPNPFTTPTMSAYLSGRQGDITAAIYDTSTGETYLYRPGVEEQTASIVKVDILATLLWQEQQQGQVPNAEQTATATGMIEQSDNDDATDLWNADGAAPGVAHFDSLAGLSATTPNFHWGETTTTPLDQVDLLKLVVYPNGFLDSVSRAYELNLMENVAGWEDWGVSSGPPTNVTVALKNGWLPLTDTDWQINSIGFVDGDGRQYLLAVMTTSSPTENYGIATIEGVSSIVWSELAIGRGPRPS